VNISASWDQIKWPRTARVQVRDLWARRDVGVFGAEGFSSLLKPHDISFIRVKRVG